MTNQEIHDICKKYSIENYSINSDGSIDVNGNVNLYDMNLTELPLKFNRVSGYFDCSYNKLTDLENFPNEIKSWFNCSYNKLTSLKGVPEKVYDMFYCGGNPLESLDGYNGNYDMLDCDNKDGLILKEKRKEKLKLIHNL